MRALAFPTRHTPMDVGSRTYLTAAEVDRWRTAARRVGRHLSSLPVYGVVERRSSESRSVPGAPELPRHGSAGGRWHDALTAWAADRVTVCTRGLGEPDVNVFVGNVAFPTTEQTLRHLFEPYAAVETVRIMPDRETGRPRGSCRAAGAGAGRSGLHRQRSAAA